MSTKMNFGPEWMRSAPAQNKQASANGSGINASSTATNGLHEAQPTATADDAGAVPADARRYTHEMMLHLFKPQDITHDFVASEHVFSSAALEPVSLTELSVKEQDLLAGPINSGSSKRYNNSSNGQQQQAPQYYSRNSTGIQRTGSYGPISGSRAKHRDDPLRIGEKLDHGLRGPSPGYPAAALNSQAAAEEEASLWAHQSLARESVGSFGADGVFRMSNADDAELLESHSSRNSTRGEVVRDTDGFASRSASPAVNSSRSGAAGILSRSQSQQRSQARLADTRSPLGSHAPPALDVSVWSLGDLGNRPPNALQQHRLLERAEQIKWWYRDPQGNIQGPFSAANMQDWYLADYFPADLQVCFEGRADFEPLSNVIARAGDSANIFLYSALAFVAQSLRQRSGISTPVTPASMSRAASAIQLSSLGPDVSASLPATVSAAVAASAASTSAVDLLLGNVHNAAMPHGSAAGLGSSIGTVAIFSAREDQQLAQSPIDKAALASSGSSANANANTNAEAVSGAAASQAVQLSALLNEQLLLVSAISDRQRTILGLQEQLQQSLSKLMQELTQETNAIHYRAQIENLPVQTELLFSLQQRAQVAEEKLRLEITQLTQIQAAQISQLEAKIDPVIKDIVLRNGTTYALNFIYQQLQELSQQIAKENSGKPSNASQTPDAGQDIKPEHAATQDSQAASAAPPQPADQSAKKQAAKPSPDTSKDQEPQSQKSQATTDTESAVAKVQKELGEMSIPSNDAPSKPSATAKGSSAAKTASSKKPADNATGSTPSSKATAAKSKASNQSLTTSDSPSAKKSASGDTKPADAAVPKAAPAAVSSPAPWSTGNKVKQPKKSLLQIQQEEEEAMKKRQQAEEQQRAQGSATRSFVGSYADRLGGGSSSAGAPRSLAAIMEEQSKESAKNNTASTFSASVAAISRPDGPRTLTLAAAAAPAPPPISQSSRSATSPSSASAWGTVPSSGSGKNNAASFALSAAAAAAASASAPASASSSAAASASASASAQHGAKNAAGSAHSPLPSSRMQSAKASQKEASAASITSTTNVAVMPSMQFLEWCYTRLGSLRGIDITKFIEVLLTFPTQPADTTLEIIAEQIYAYSQTLNGRAFAEDFVTRRRKDFGAVRNGSLKSAPANWMQLLNKSSSDRSSAKSISSGGSADFITVSSASASRNSTDSSFQVVGKKSRK
ncbi:kinesin-like protein [Coemansia sp. RSA 1722]|nr:kinesin-like protein [Coemansia sp. RSA 485]KAJ2602035.1 kinesin-like protein [Coemansia sp. RSA 1722]